MIADMITDIKNNPDWIGYGLLLLAVAAILIVTLYFGRRRGALKEAHAEIDAFLERIEEQAGEISEIRHSLSIIRSENTGLQTSLAGLAALDNQRLEQGRDLEFARKELTDRTAEVARLNEALTRQEQANVEKIALLNSTGEKLKGEFKALAADVMRTHGEDFEKANTERLKQTLTPLKEHIGRFETELREVHKSADKDRAALKTEILNLTAQSLQVSEEAHNLTQALKGDSQKQGAWGEMVLASILDRSGLREGEEYVTQAHHRDEAGRSLRPDVVVNLPGGRRLVVDSKVSMVAYERSVNADNAAARDLALKAHVASVKSHIDTLSKKNYHQLDDGSVDYVIMFMPIESAFSEAVRADDNLALYATEKDVVIASPTNLMVALKTVENLWSVENRNRNAMEIAKRAGLLYDKFHGFVEDMDKIGAQLDRATAAHTSAMGKLTTGSGNLVNQAEKLKKLGARATKQLDLDHDSDDEDLLLDAPTEGS